MAKSLIFSSILPNFVAHEFDTHILPSIHLTTHSSIYISSPHPFVVLLVLALVVQVFSWLGPREPKSVCWDHFSTSRKISVPFCRLEHQGKNKHDTFLPRCQHVPISVHTFPENVTYIFRRASYTVDICG